MACGASSKVIPLLKKSSNTRRTPYAKIQLRRHGFAGEGDQRDAGGRESKRSHRASEGNEPFPDPDCRDRKGAAGEKNKNRRQSRRQKKEQLKHLHQDSR